MTRFEMVSEALAQERGSAERDVPRLVEADA
jgi:hypothetical protein